MESFEFLSEQAANYTTSSSSSSSLNNLITDNDYNVFSTNNIIINRTESFLTTFIPINKLNLTNNSNDIDVNYIELHSDNNYWALLALILVFGTAAGNILVCLAIAWERRLQNVTNYFLMSLAMTDLMVAILVMPLGILTLYVGYFPLQSEHCLVWICLDVLFCTASIMHLCTISVDRYLSLRYPMRFGRNKTRKRVILKIIFVWILSIAMSLPLSLMYSKDHASVLVNGTCQIPDPVYKLVGSIVCFYIPLGVMLLTYCLTVRLLARQRQNLGGTNNNNQQTTTTAGWSSGWLGQAPALERRCTWRRLLKTSHQSTPSHGHSATSTDTELSNLDNHELWLPDSSIPEPTPSTMTALHQFGAEMLKLSRGLESVSSSISGASTSNSQQQQQQQQQIPLIQTAANKINHLTSFSQNERNDDNHHHQHQHQQHQHSTHKHQQNENHEKLDLDEILQVECEHSQSPPSIAKKFISYNKKRRRASTSTPGNKYLEGPTTPPPRRKRFNSLPKNALHNHNHHQHQHQHHHHHHHHCIDYNNDKALKLAASTTQSTNMKILNKIRENSRKNCYDKNCHNVTKTNKKDYDDVNDDDDDNDDDNNIQLPPPCTCPYFGDLPHKNNSTNNYGQVKIISNSKRNQKSSFESNDKDSTENYLITNPTTQTVNDDDDDINDDSSRCDSVNKISKSLNCSSNYLPIPSPSPVRKLSYSKTASVVTWDSSRHKRRGSSFVGVRTSLLLTPTKIPLQSGSPLRRSATLRNHNNLNYLNGSTNNVSSSLNNNNNNLKSNKIPSSSPCLLQRTTTVRSHHSRNSSVISRNSARHGRIIRLEQKATKVLGVVFFTFVILWAPFFVLTLLPTFCDDCEENIAHWVFDVVTWLGYASSMVNPIFYTIFNKVFRQAFKKVLLCQYASGAGAGNNHWRPNR